MANSLPQLGVWKISDYRAGSESVKMQVYTLQTTQTYLLQVSRLFVEYAVYAHIQGVVGHCWLFPS